MIAIGLLIFLFLSHNDKLRAKIISSETFFNSIFFGLISAIIGGRILAVINDWYLFKQNPIEIFLPWIGGFSILGSILGVIIVIPLYLKKKNVPILTFFDLITTYAPLLQAISRIGCFLAGCCYGKIVTSSSIWSVTFTNPQCLAPLHVPLYPTQLYSSLASFFIFIFLFIKSKYFKNKPGEILFSYLLLESLARYAVQFWRADQDYYSQPIAIAIFIFSIIGLIYIQTRKNKI